MSNVLFTLNSDKDQRKFSLSLSVNEPSLWTNMNILRYWEFIQLVKISPDGTVFWKCIEVTTHLEALALLCLVYVVEDAVVWHQQSLTLEWTNCKQRQNHKFSGKVIYASWEKHSKLSGKDFLVYSLNRFLMAKVPCRNIHFLQWCWIHSIVFFPILYLIKIRLIRLVFTCQKKNPVFDPTTYWFPVRSLNHYTNWANCEWETQKSFQ